MASASATKTRSGLFAPLSAMSDNLLAIIVRLVLIMLLDAWTMVLVYRFIRDGSIGFAITIALVVLAINIVFLRNATMPLRWVIPGLAFMVMFHIYPVLFTVSTAFTNYSDGHLVEKPVAIRQIESQTYAPDSAIKFSWSAYENPDGQIGLWLVGPDGQNYWAIPGAFTPSGEVALGEMGDDGNPLSVEGYQKIPSNRRLATLSQLQNVTFGDEGHSVTVTSGSNAIQLEQRYIYNPDNDTFTDQTDGAVYTAIRGTYTSADGKTLIPGFPVNIGLDNFIRIFRGPAIRGPMVLIFSWTFIYAFMSVLLTFSLGLLLALVLNDPILPGRRLIRVLMVVPYAIPAFISVLIWRGMFNPILGVIGSNTPDIGWFTSPFWAKVGILLVQLWVGFPYMFLITTGALQGIPGDIYEAAKVDGASGILQFRRITLPLLLIAVGPLLIGSFAFNFNNFTIIDLYNRGGPPIANTPAPAGHTDILISFTYRLAFGGGRGADYGLAAAISIIIFIIVAVITLINFRYTGMLEEISENV
ncbi:MAG: ABC transporter permease subunit [Caldilineales bacterium]|nr:ABC transporter permease subunit [Caldilineales bacterium]